MLTCEQLIQQFTLTNLTHNQGNVQHLLNNPSMAIHQVVQNHRPKACYLQSPDNMAANAASTTRN